jgi:hypothetical protein
VIIWSRWGILSFAGFGVGVALALACGNLFGVTGGPGFGALVFFWAAMVNLLLAFQVYPRVDKPRPLTLTKQLAQPYTWPDGRVQTHEVVPALDPAGQQVWTKPRSTLFFIPADLIWIPLLLGAAGLGIAAIFVH